MVDYNTTPNNVDQYSRYMANKFDEHDQIWNPTGWLSVFGRPETGAETLYSPNALDVDIDIIRANEKIAALIPRGTVSRPVGDTQQNTQVERYSPFSRTFPLSEEEGDIDANVILNREAGEGAYEGRDKLTRLRNKARKIHSEHVRRTIRMFEYLAQQSVLEGQMPAIIGTVDPDLIYNWRRNAAHISTLAKAWTDPTSDPLADIDAAWYLGRTNGRVSQDYCVFAEDVMNAFLNHADIVEKSDNRRYELIEVNQDMPAPSRYKFLVDGGMTARGRLRTPGGHEYWMFTYSDIYDNNAGTPVKLMPDGYALFGYSGARCDRYFGPAELLPMLPVRAQFIQQMFGFNPTAAPMPPKVKNMGNAIQPGMFYFDAYADNSWKRVTVRTQSAPIFATTQTDSFVTYKGAA
jgi:hypothetical protein